LYTQGRSLRQIGAEMGVHWSTVSQQLQSAGMTMRRGGPPVHRAATQEILELRDRGLTWSEVAEQVDMTVSAAWSGYRKARPPKSPRRDHIALVQNPLPVTEAVNEYTPSPRVAENSAPAPELIEPVEEPVRVRRGARKPGYVDDRDLESPRPPLRDLVLGAGVKYR
jgi:hypothetical protein